MTRHARSVVAVLITLPFVVPFAWLVLGALKPLDQFLAAPPTLLPDPPSLDTLATVLSLVDVPRMLGNSLFVAAISVALTLIVASTAGFAFATVPARGRRPLFALLILTVLVPATALVVPQAIVFRELGWIGTYLPLIGPQVAGGAFAIILFRQWFRSLPAHLFESAELDGATPFQAYRHIALPLARPAIAAVAVLAFVASWNDVLGPVVYLRDPAMATVGVGLASFQGVYVNQSHLVIGLALLALVPPIVVFLVAQRALVRGIATTGWRA